MTYKDSPLVWFETFSKHVSLKNSKSSKTRFSTKYVSPRLVEIFLSKVNVSPRLVGMFLSKVNVSPRLVDICLPKCQCLAEIGRHLFVKMSMSRRDWLRFSCQRSMSRRDWSRFLCQNVNVSQKYWDKQRIESVVRIIFEFFELVLEQNQITLNHFIYIPNLPQSQNLQIKSSKKEFTIHQHQPLKLSWYTSFQ